MNMNKNWQEWLSSNNRGWRLIVGFICVFFLALFLHFREVRVEVLEVNTTASRYIVAQIDFEFPDYETTIVLRQQAMQDVGNIYQIDDKQIRDARYLLEEDLIRNKNWRRAAPQSTFEEMYKAADELETLLLEARFTDPRTIQKIKEMGLPDNSYYEFVSEGTHSSIGLSPEFWERTSQQILQSDAFHKETVGYVIRSFEARDWNLVQDTALERSLQARVGRTIPEKMTKVYAGTRIIDQGENVTSRHLTMVQSMKQAISESRKLWDPLTIIASFVLSIIFVTISGLYFRISQPTFIRSLREISLFVCIVLLTLLFAKFTEYILLKSSSDIIGAVRFPIVAPFATILICILLSPRTALFAATFLSIILSVSLAVDHSHFLILNLVTSIVVIIGSRGLRKRKEVFTVCMKSWLSAIPVLFAFTFAENHFASYMLLIDIGASFVFLLITAVLVVGILPALETLFGIITDMTLMEYTDPSSDLLRRFAVEVPGTYQHSLVLGNLAEICAGAIGANGLFCRAATLYHDIGKINNPQFYTENQQGVVNIHQLLTPLESAQVIISHVTDGEEIAKKARLPQSFIDIIREHHGTTLVYYFYRKQLELKGNRVEEVDEAQFRYPGPRPRTKESAIIMICDTIEAATRSLEIINEQTLTELVNRLVSEKAEDSQFDDCQLTFEELANIKKTLVKTLLLSHHVRVKYPKKEKPNS
ncbi:MAG: hydrolase [Chlamydiae bacterium CG10_big_fil_rev_8_21_14_0_10_42_34]|nr:MAG: hydrolase [Chlamydiae bacterium CG10_big_fil_rev_8_21_14_0_10_42_34]